jgi:SAM-dependent methyltransferase
METIDMKAYAGFLEGTASGSLRSAEEVVPLVLRLIHPKRVVDVGCGLGAWLAVFQVCGVDDIWGVDGDYIDRKALQIPRERFLPCDLKEPLRMDEKFDLVLSLEVAEHIPSQCAETFVNSLINLGPVILFSAAIPFQGGVNHVNEQWPEYWAKKFQERGYIAIDCIRKKIWKNEKVEWWYAQNILVFARNDCLEDHPALKKEYENSYSSQLSIVHPYLYEMKNLSAGKKMKSKMKQGLKNILRSCRW